MTLTEFLCALDSDQGVEFEDSMQVIAENYRYQPVGFVNGDLENAAGQNEGSCKIFAFARLNQLSEAQTLRCFGRFHQDVLNTPEGSDHGNIRNFMQHGWQGIRFSAEALTAEG